MIKPWKVKAYAVLVKAEKWELEHHKGNALPVVPKDYAIAVTKFLATGELLV